MYHTGNHHRVEYVRNQLVEDLGNERIRCRLCSLTLLNRMHNIKRHYASKHNTYFTSNRRIAVEKRTLDNGGEGSSNQAQEDTTASDSLLKTEPLEVDDDDYGEEEYRTEGVTVAGWTGSVYNDLQRDPIEGMFRGVMDMFRGLKPATQRRVMKEINSSVIDAFYSDKMESEKDD